MRKTISPTLVNVLLTLAIMLTSVGLLKSINFSYFTYSQSTCIEAYLGKTLDNNAYLIDMMWNGEIGLAQRAYNLTGNQLSTIAESERRSVDELNDVDIGYLAQHPEWRYSNLTKLGPALENLGITLGEYRFSNPADLEIDLGLICPKQTILN